MAQQAGWGERKPTAFLLVRAWEWDLNYQRTEQAQFLLLAMQIDTVVAATTDRDNCSQNRYIALTFFLTAWWAILSTTRILSFQERLCFGHLYFTGALPLLYFNCFISRTS